MKKEKPTSVRLIEINEHDFLVREPSNELKNSFDEKNVIMHLDLNFKSADLEDILILNLSIRYEYNRKLNPLELLKTNCSFHFRIHDLGKLVKVHNNTINIKEPLARSLMSVAISTTRGIIAARTNGYFIHRFYLPIVNTHDIAEQFNLKFNQE